MPDFPSCVSRGDFVSMGSSEQAEQMELQRWCVEQLFNEQVRATLLVSTKQMCSYMCMRCSPV